VSGPKLKAESSKLKTTAGLAGVSAFSFELSVFAARITVQVFLKAA
jgi:hypothetical protein